MANNRAEGARDLREISERLKELTHFLAIVEEALPEFPAAVADEFNPPLVSTWFFDARRQVETAAHEVIGSAEQRLGQITDEQP